MIRSSVALAACRRGIRHACCCVVAILENDIFFLNILHLKIYDQKTKMDNGMDLLYGIRLVLLLGLRK